MIDSINPIEIASSPCGSFLLAGIIIASPTGYAFAMQTVLKQAKEMLVEKDARIMSQNDKIEQLELENRQLMERLLSASNGETLHETR